ncbi:MAG: cob(I)yrinic acid a,c-diamide adenosyltransferase [candidate division Zixibacteria bacterium]|jgi:cob(I)alamin adenosyltransferase|nr:cob(I)yrinic acid a,c-diamide adenosyltransferase [candidate division Zixibacteria bacterium]
MSENTRQEKGLLIVYTGDGKGKTTAALGMTVRAIGYDWQVCIIQFIKGSWKYGELDGIKKLAPNVELNVMGEGFVGIIDDKKSFEEHRAAARKAYEMALEKISAQKYQLIILDELNVAVNLGLISREELENIIAAKPENLHLVITGRSAIKWLIDKADLVTEMKEIKHPYQKGILAQKGVDF